MGASTAPAAAAAGAVRPYLQPRYLRRHRGVFSQNPVIPALPVFTQFGNLVVGRDVDRVQIGRTEPFTDITRGSIVGVGRDPEFLKAMPKGQGPKDTRRLSRVLVAAMDFVDRISDMTGIEPDTLGVPDAKRYPSDFDQVLTPGDREMIARHPIAFRILRTDGSKQERDINSVDDFAGSQCGIK
jgi:hypothetical protein